MRHLFCLISSDFLKFLVFYDFNDSGGDTADQSKQYTNIMLTKTFQSNSLSN